MLTRRGLLSGFCSMLIARAPAYAQNYPAKPVRMIVPYAAGGATDILARLLATRVDHELKQSIVIDIGGGGASQAVTQALGSAAPDGYPIGMIDSVFTINPGLFAGRLPYDAVKDSLPANSPGLIESAIDHADGVAV